MSDELKEMLRHSVEWFEPSPFDPEQRQSRAGPTRRRTKVVTALVAFSVFAASAVFAWAAFRPVDRSIPGDSTDFGTYALSHFSVAPYRDPRTKQIDESKASVSFVRMWTGDVYPGNHNCTVRVFDAQRVLIGSLSFELSAMTERADGPLEVDVSGSVEGATADGSCRPERLDMSVAYVITNVHLVLNGDLGSRLVFDVAWPPDLPEGAYPSQQACVTALWTSGGELLKQHRSTLGAPPKRGMSIGAFAFVPDDASAATLTCEPFTRDDAFPDPEPPADPSVSNIMTSSRIVTVPAVVGLTSDQARAEIAGSGLNVGRIAYDAAEPDAVFGTIGGRVVEQDPAAGTKVPAGTAVDLVLRPSGGVPWACPSPERIDFPAPSGGRVLPAGSAYIRGNLTGILRSDDIERMTVDPNGATDSNGVWRIVREGAVVAVVYPKLDGTACSGSGIEGT